MSRITPLARVLLLGGAVVTAACSDPASGPAQENRYGAIDIRGKATSATAVSARATAVFFDGIVAAVPNSAEQRLDQCVYRQLDTTSFEVNGANQAGTTVDLAIRAQTVAMPWETTLKRYATPTANRFAYAAGDTARITVPGNGTVYPAASLNIRLAEPILPGPVVVPAGGQPLVLTWNASTDTTTAVLVSVRYANPPSSAEANWQIYCALKDDGRYDIQSNALVDFFASPNARRSVSFIRYRTNETLLDDRTVLHIATTVDTVVRF